jgi:hypothetical protein
MTSVSNGTGKIEEVGPLHLGNMHNFQAKDMRRTFSLVKYGDFPDEITGMV